MSRYKRPLRLCVINKILGSANAKYHYIKGKSPFLQKTKQKKHNGCSLGYL